LLHSMLSSGILSHPISNPLLQQPLPTTTSANNNNIISPTDEESIKRNRSWSMPINANRPPLPPQISISSPDEPQDLFCKSIDNLTRDPWPN
jgi:hypothetical protein